MRFIIVHDNARFRKYLRDFIVMQNDDCMEVHDEININKIIEEYKPDWLIIDIGHKKIKGFELTGEIKVKYPFARIIIIADYIDERLQAKAHEVGAYAFVSKENLFELYELIHSHDNNHK